MDFNLQAVKVWLLIFLNEWKITSSDSLLRALSCQKTIDFIFTRTVR